jgi:hypothetical protein
LTRVDAAGALSVCAYALLAVLSHGNENVHIGAFLGIIFAAWAFVGFACTAEGDIPAKKIWLWAIAFRIAGFFGQPILEDDWHRYLWDGWVFAHTGNPYDKAPNLFFAAPGVPPRLETVLEAINHPDVPTTYAPVCQLLFLISYWIAPGKLWPLKLLLLVADLAGIAAVARLLAKQTGSRLADAELFTTAGPPKGWRRLWIAATRRRWCAFLLYAWCPLLVKEVAFTAHPDVIGIALLLAALVVRRPRNVAILCALAVGTKIFAAPIALLLVLGLPKKHWITFVAVLGALYAPFWLQRSMADLSALKAFASDWEFNSTLYGVIGIWTGEQVAKLICGAVFLILYALYASKWKGGVPRGDWIFGAFFLLSAVVNPWYLLWMAPFVALYPTSAGVAALMIVSVAYAHGLNLPGSGLGPYDHPTWVRVVEVFTIFVAGSLEYLVRVPVAQTRA